jgi:hypothetical protein
MKKDRDLPCHTTDPQGRGVGGWGWVVVGGKGGEGEPKI